MTVEIKEVKKLIDCAKRFLKDETNIQELHGHTQELLKMTAIHGQKSALNKYASEWIEMSYRYWNEFGDSKNPITLEEFKNWIRDQLQYPAVSFQTNTSSGQSPNTN